MPRAPRIDAPGLVQHVMARGIEKRRIFNDGQDRAFFLRKLGEILTETNTKCYGWVFMKNHVHLLLRTGDQTLGHTMNRLLGAYATYFNLKTKRVGHLFQNRFKSIVVDESNYLATLIAYIHLNPIKAGMIADLPGLSRYKWSGHYALIGEAEHPWQETQYVLEFFGGARQYLEYLHVWAEKERPDLDGGGLKRTQKLKEAKETKAPGCHDPRILGESDFTRRILEVTENAHSNPTQDILDHLFLTVCQQFELGDRELSGTSRTRHVSLARGVLSAAGKRFGFSAARLAKQLSITEAAVAKAVARGERSSELVATVEEQVKRDLK